MRAPASITRDGLSVIVTCHNEAEAIACHAGLLSAWKGAPALNSNEAVRLHHINKGCCDGSDPSGCYKTRMAKEADERIRTRVENRRYLDNEYFGTEPSEGDMAFCEHGTAHHRLKMGDKCIGCGMIA